MVFFGLQQPPWAIVVIVALFAAAVWTAIGLKRVSRISAVLFVPYIIWSGFAGILNAAIVFMN